MTRRIARSGAVLMAAVVLAIVALLAPSPAEAHENPAIAVRLTEVAPALRPGVKLSVIDGEKSALALTNPTTTPAFALSPEGDPFLQVSSDGVFGDVSSPYLSVPAGVAARATDARLDCCPQGVWMRLRDDGVWAWSDPRLDPPLDPEAVNGADRGLASLDTDRPLATWEVGLRYDEVESTATGVLERRPLGRLRTTLELAPPGLTASVIDASRPQLLLETASGTTLEVLGGDGAAVLRLSEQGAYARAESAEYQAHTRGIGSVPKAGTGWVRIAERGTVQWADPRLGFSGQRPADGRTGPVELGRWRVPVLVNGQAAEITGRQNWEPVEAPLLGVTGATAADDGSGGPVQYVVGALLTVAVVAAYLLARRRGGRTEDEGGQ